MASVPIDCRPSKLSGKTCIVGTRIPVTTLFNHLAIGGTIHSFAEEYPGVTAAQAQDVVTFAGRDMAGDPLAVERARVDVERLDLERPSGCEVLTIAESIPVMFESCPAVYDSMRAWLAGELKVRPKQIGHTGSARFDSSFAARKKGKPLGPRSDLELFVVSEALFGALCADFNTWRDDYRSGRKTDNNTDRRFWKHNVSEVPGTISRGFIIVDRIPALDQYKTAKRILRTMDDLVQELEAAPRSPSPKEVSMRCYEHWGSMVSQMSLNLAVNASEHDAKRWQA